MITYVLCSSVTVAEGASFRCRINDYDLNQKTTQLIAADIEKNIQRVKR